MRRYRQQDGYVIGNDGFLPLTQRRVAVVDARFLDELCKRAWHFTHGYARNKSGKDGLYLHHAVLALAGVERGSLHVDHINVDSLDCRLANLRVTTRTENQINRGLQRNNTSGFRGVYLNKRSGRWFAVVKRRGVNRFRATFRTKEEAAAAYDAAAIAYGSEIVQLNLPAS